MREAGFNCHSRIFVHSAYRARHPVAHPHPIRLAPAIAPKPCADICDSSTKGAVPGRQAPRVRRQTGEPFSRVRPHSNCVPGPKGKPRRKSAPPIGFLPARWT